MRAALLSLALLLLLSPAEGQAQERGADTWFTQRMTIGPGPILVEHLWSKGPQLRAEAVIRGRPVLTLVSGRRYMIVDVLGRSGVSIERSPVAIADDASRGRPFGIEGTHLIEAGAELVGTEVVQGQEVEHYRLTDRRGRKELWTTPDAARLPVRFSRWDRKASVEIQYNYLDWTHGLELPDAFFQPSPEITLEQVGYDEYVSRSKAGPVGPAPPFFSSLLHGSRAPVE